MATYRVDSTRTRLVVKARSSIHDTTTTWNELSGTIEADPATLVDTGATASFTVNMTAFDAGDWLKNRKLRKDFDMPGHPTATFELTRLRDVVRQPDGTFTATAEGTLGWRGRELGLSVSGRGSIDDRGIAATGTFDMDIRDLGLEPPRFLMFKVESEVTVEVTLHATSTAQGY